MWQCENCRNQALRSRETRSKAKRLQKLSKYYAEETAEGKK